MVQFYADKELQHPVPVPEMIIPHCDCGVALEHGEEQCPICSGETAFIYDMQQIIDNIELPDADEASSDDLVLEIARTPGLPGSSLSFNQQIEASRETGLCVDGHPCGKPKHDIEQEHCDWCPNAPDFNGSEHVDDISVVELDHIADASEKVGMAALYPAYYKDVRHLDSVDVYQVHNLFGIDDPTGCIHHASKKLLLSGARTGGKPKRKDIQEARDTLQFADQIPGEWDADKQIQHLREQISLARGHLERGIENQTTPIAAIIAERQRQISVEGWTPEHDDEHSGGELPDAAACYALAAAEPNCPVARPGSRRAFRYWPWAPEWWKPSTPMRNLEKAGALIVAEMERLERMEAN